MKLINKLNKLESVEDIKGKVVSEVITDDLSKLVCIIFTDNSLICFEGSRFYDINTMGVSYDELSFELHDWSYYGLEMELERWNCDDEIDTILGRLISIGLISTKDIEGRMEELKSEECESKKLKETDEYKEYLKLKEKYESI